MNHLSRNLKFTVESPQDYSDGWLPTLDFSLRFDSENNRIEYKYYEKPVSTKWVLPPTTEVDPNTLTQQLANDLVRRLSRISPEIRQQEEVKTINQYSDRLKWSGHDKEKRKTIIEMGIGAFQEKLKRNKMRIHKSANETEQKRNTQKLIGLTTWYKPWGRAPGIFSNLERKEGGKGGRRNIGGNTPAETTKKDKKEVVSTLVIERTKNGELTKKTQRSRS